MPVEKGNNRFLDTQTGGEGSTEQVGGSEKSSGVLERFAKRMSSTNNKPAEPQPKQEPVSSGQQTQSTDVSTQQPAPKQGPVSAPNMKVWKEVYDWTVNSPTIDQKLGFDDFVKKYSSDEDKMWNLYSVMYKRLSLIHI